MDDAYIHWIQELKQKIKSAQLKASIAVNEEMILLYWDIGKSIVEKQLEFAWGSKVVEQMAKDLKKELPDTQGFSRTNLFSMRKFYLFYANASIVQQAAGQLQKNDNQGNSQIIHQAGGRNENDESQIIHQAGGQLYKDHIFFSRCRCSPKPPLRVFFTRNSCIPAKLATISCFFTQCSRFIILNAYHRVFNPIQ